VQKEDIHVSIESNQVTINAEARELPWQTGSTGQKSAPAQQGDPTKHLRRERHLGRIYRSFILPVEIDDSNARAKYDYGVLTLTLPKKQQLGKQLAIE
jgi:HSP20 family protein